MVLAMMHNSSYSAKYGETQVIGRAGSGLTSHLDLCLTLLCWRMTTSAFWKKFLKRVSLACISSAACCPYCIGRSQGDSANMRRNCRPVKSLANASLCIQAKDCTQLQMQHCTCSKGILSCWVALARKKRKVYAVRRHNGSLCL